MDELNLAQQLLQSLGAPVASFPKQAHGGKKPSATKSGAGRYHKAAHTKDSPRASKGAPRGFVQHTTDKARRDKRALNAMVGHRAVKRERTAVLRAIKAARKHLGV